MAKEKRIVNITKESEKSKEKFGKDAKGNILGYEIEIDGKTYHVLSTDSNGKLILPLTNGDYKAVEVQAADDKYEIDNKGTYFTVGPTVQYGAGINYIDSFMLSYVNN